MKFIVREMAGEPPAVGITGVDHEFDYLDEAQAKLDELGQGRGLLAVTMGRGMYVEAAPVITALKGEARTRLYAAWRPLHPDDGDDAFTAFLDSAEGIEANRVHRRVIVDEMAGRS